MSTVKFNGRDIDLDAARMLMDDDIAEDIHGLMVTGNTDQDYFDLYVVAHEAYYHEPFAFN